MYKIKLASYKNSKSMFANWIRFKQKHIEWLEPMYSGLSHSEIVFCYNDDKEVLKKIERLKLIYWTNYVYADDPVKDNFKKYHLWFSSEEWIGTRFKFIEDDKDNWVYTEYEVTKENYLNALDYAISKNDKPYNYIWIVVNHLFKINWFRRPLDNFCSQIWWRILQVLNWEDRIESLVWLDSINISPWKLAKLSDNK